MADLEKYLEDSLKYDRFVEAAEGIKNMPEGLQNFNLIMICALDPTGKVEPVARILAEYGIQSQKIIPCILDLIKIIGKPRPEHGSE